MTKCILIYELEKSLRKNLILFYHKKISNMEQWKAISSHYWYSISESWRISNSKSKIIWTHLHRKWYIFSNIKWHPLVHRLVAIAFIPNPLNLPEVNHKDWNKLNCHKDNLEWSTWSDNVKHAYSLWLMKNNMKWKFWSENHSSVSIRQFDISWKFIKSFWSQLEAMRETWVLNTKISDCCKWRQKTAGWFIWKYS